MKEIIIKSRYINKSKVFLYFCKPRVTNTVERSEFILFRMLYFFHIRANLIQWK